MHGSTIYSQGPDSQHAHESLSHLDDMEDAPAPAPKVVMNLGTFMWPNKPFPYLFDLVPPPFEKEETSKANNEDNKPTGTDDEGSVLVDEETRATIVVPPRFFALALEGKPKIWGGGGPPTGKSRIPRRRVYTDDSDLVLCALHSGHISKQQIKDAAEREMGMKLELRVVRCLGSGYGVYSQSNVAAAGGRKIKVEVIGRFLGGTGEKLRTKQEDGDNPENDGRSIESCGWGGGHDGSGIEVISVEFVKACL